MAAEVASASVSVLPTFKGGAKELERIMGPALDRAGIDGGRSYGAAFASGIMSSPVISKLLAAGGVGGILFAGFDRLTAIDTAKAKLDAFGYSAAQVESIMKSANDAVLGTQFALSEAATQASAAVASGVQQGEELTKYLTRVADVSAATSSAMSDIGMVLNQVNAAGRLYTQDANQLVARGIPVWKLVAEQYQVTAAESRKLVEQGKVDAQTFFNAIDGYIGGTAKNMDSFQSNLANLRASLGRIGAGLLGGDLDGPKNAVKELTDVLKTAEPAAAAIGTVLTGTLGVINAIPGPVLLAAAGLGILAKYRAPLGSMFDTIRLKGMYAAETFTAMRTQAQLAGATMPGVTVGLASVASGARATGSALLGAFGGPVGLALTGVGLALGGVIALWQQGEQAAAGQKAAVDELTASFDQNTGAMTENTFTKIAKDLDATLVKMDQLGISTDGVARKVAEGGPAFDALRRQLQGIVDAGTTSRLDRVSGQWVPEISADARIARDALQALETQSKTSTDAQKQFQRQMSATGNGLQELTNDTKDFSAAIDTAFAGLNGMANQSTAIRNLAESIRDNGNAIDSNTQGGIANLEALQGTISAMAEAAGDDYSTFVGNVSGLMQYLDQAGVSTQNVMGAVRAAVANVAGKRWAMYFDGSQAIGEASQIVKAMRTAVAAAAAAQAAGKGALAGALGGSAVSAVVQYNRAVAAAAAGNAYVGSTFRGVSSSASRAGSSVGKAGSSARKTASDLRSLRLEIVALAKDWLQPSRYSSEATSLIDRINAAYKEGAVSKRSRDSLITSVKRSDLQLERISKARERMADRIADANAKLQEAVEARTSFRQSIIDGFRDLGDLTRFANQTEKTVTEMYTQGDRLFSVTTTLKANSSAKELVSGLRSQVAEAKKFKAAFTQLQKLGLNDNSLQNLMSDFLSTGDSSLASNLAAGGKSAVGEVNGLMKELGDLTGTETKGWAKELADDMFGAGVNTAKGFLKGLESQDSALRKQYEKMAYTLVATIKKKLGIKSPSRVMAGLAEYTSQGWNDNIHLDAVTPGIDVTGMTSTFGGAGTGLSSGTELWLMLDDDRPVRGIVTEVLAGDARAKIAARRGGKR